MLKFNKDQKRIPFGGHHYPEYGMTFRGESVPELVTKVTDFRVNNHIPVGDPEQDILLFYLKHWPWLIKESGDQPAEGPSSEYIEWRAWIGRAWNHPPTKIITVKEAKERWAKCEGCPFNTKLDWKESRETSEITRRAFMLRRGIEVPEHLGYCALHHTDLSVFSFLDKPTDYSTKREDENHDACWVLGKAP